MKVKSLMLVLGTGIVFSLSGCGGGSSTSTEEPVVESRTDLAHAGEAEYPTGIHYGNTLFDSADKKCQNCHFELYDTWKTSMHSKSWTDAIFQTKYQEYLRIQLSKIGTTVATGSYTVGTITGPNPKKVGDVTYSDVRNGGGTSRVCLKCHAPGAYYAGDFNISVEKVGDSTTYDGMNATALRTYLNGLEKDKTDTLNATTVASVGKDGNVYTATYHIGHEANREGINCATCHSIESIRLMGVEGTEGVRDGGELTLKTAIKYGPIGATRFAAGTTLEYDSNATNPHMNGFFSLLGPELYSDINDTPQDAEGMNNNMSKKSADGRFTFRSVDINGTNGKTHYTGGPFYGPYGITGTNNSNEDDDSNRLASSLGEDEFQAKDNHFSKHAKALCLSCHQRSAGAKDPNAVEDNQMELCSTWNAMSDGVDDNFLDTASSPKCTKCHMPRLNDKTVLHKWNKPNELFTRDELLTGYFDPEDGDNYGEAHNPVFGKWMNDHGFIGGNRQSGNNFKNKVISGFEADVTAEVNENVLTVTTHLLNQTAHMLPGAHPMRRMLTRVIVTDDTGAMVAFSEAKGNSTFENIINTVEPSNSNDTINTTGTGRGSVGVEYESERKIEISGLAPDLSDSDVTSQKFANTLHNITAADVIAKINNIVEKTTTSGTTYDVNATVTNAAIIEDVNTSTFTRIYGRETGQIIDNIFIVRPGFDSNTVPDGKDNRLVPNEKEIYTINYTIDPSKTYTITYKVYYLLTGANGSFPVGADGWHVDGSNLNIYEVFSKQISQ
ncbi:MAG TPA: multiheme c-type cytochrome [Sulfurovum sp.]